MSAAPENEFDLEKLFLPAWAQEPSSAKYARYEGEDTGDRRGDDRRGPRPPRRDRPREGRRDENRARGPRRDSGGPRGDRRGPDRGDKNRPGSQDRGFSRGDRGDQRPRREAPLPLPEINVSLIPDEKGVESLARQIKMTGRAYPLFDIAQMILQKPERHSVAFSVKKNAEGQPVQPLWICALDDTLWLSEDEAIAHVLKKHFNTFYQAERTATEPPKGKYTFVAQCGVSGVILGPPNYHDYQNQLRKLHAERFSRMPFEAFKSRVRIVRDEEVVKKWIDEQSFRTEYLCLNLPDALRLGNMEAVEKHFRETHKENIIKQVESHTLTGATARVLRSPELTRLLRSVWEDQRRFPLQIATVLSQQFAGHGLQFFKVNKTITHVSVARPHYLDLEANPVSDGVKRIVDYINAHAKCTRRDLVESLAPSPPPAPLAVGQEKAEPAAEHQPTPEQTAVISDLHWLIHQGHVIEFANGTLETAKKPLPRPPKPAPAKAAEPAGDSPAAAETAGPAAEAAASGAPAGTQTSEQTAEPSPAEADASETGAPAEMQKPAEELPPTVPDAELSSDSPQAKEHPVESAAAPVDSPS